MEDRASVLAAVCQALSAGSPLDAANVLNRSYPFTGPPATPRRYGPAQATSIFVRDGFIDRYSGLRVVFPPVLRAISLGLPVDFPYHPNWKMDVTHPAYWELTATIDHVEAASRGGADDESNWVTTSMARNSAKGNHSLEDLGWSLLPPGDFSDWDGLMRWFVEYTDEHPDALVDASMKKWRQAAVGVLTNKGFESDSRGL